MTHKMPPISPEESGLWRREPFTRGTHKQVLERYTDEARLNIERIVNRGRKLAVRQKRRQTAEPLTEGESHRLFNQVIARACILFQDLKFEDAPGARDTRRNIQAPAKQAKKLANMLLSRDDMTLSVLASGIELDPLDDVKGTILRLQAMAEAPDKIEKQHRKAVVNAVYDLIPIWIDFSGAAPKRRSKKVKSLKIKSLQRPSGPFLDFITESLQPVLPEKYNRGSHSTSLDNAGKEALKRWQ